ncbi:MAG TPA: group III truncated hemoglobin [Flavobacteriales bacterium]|nr:group III truncated hemoglobin [Flavobacteriales bacterium]HRE95142.1 group III truncated hemoglobin [Flavobacteriales bacterium]HRJ36757.1 group III truncated hemoglobin [Flavobacteriales bacterium]
MSVEKKDIESRADIEQMVKSFYAKVLADPLIAPFFTNVVNVDWDHHLPVMFIFWESILFDKPVYSGNPMMAHISLHQKSPMKPEHFQRWLLHFETNLREQFQGPVTERASQRAMSIAAVIQSKTTSI